VENHDVRQPYSNPESYAVLECKVAKRDPTRLKKLTDAGIQRLRYHPKRAEVGPGSRIVIHDEDVRGLQLRVTPNVKTFCVYLRPRANALNRPDVLPTTTTSPHMKPDFSP
jgi:hypothetical protein